MSATYYTATKTARMNAVVTQIGTSGSLPRPEVPEWCNYLILIIDLFAVDNNGGNVFFDNLQVEQW